MAFDPSQLSLPPGLELRMSAVEYEQLGIWCTKDVPCEEFLGPYEGEIIAPSEDDGVDYQYAWEVCDDDDNITHIVNATDPKDGNWMRYVRSARCFDEQNVVSIQKDGHIYYKVFKPIMAGQEMLVWLSTDVKMKHRVERQRKRKAEARAAARARARERAEQERKESNSSEQSDEEEEPVTVAKGKRKLCKKMLEDYEYDHLTKKPKTEGKGSRETRVVQEVCAAATQMTKGDMTTNNIKTYGCRPDQVYAFDMSQNLKGTGRTGRPCFRCRICDSAQPSMESLRKHCMSSHINYRYLSKPDQEKYQVVATKQELKIRGRYNLNSGRSPSNDSLEEKSTCPRPGLYRCHACYELFDAVERLSQHLKDKNACPGHQLRSQPLGCQSCQETFCSLRALLTHMTRQHSEAESSFRLCDQCGQEFPSASDVRRHRCPSSPVEFRCSPCQLRFKSQVELQRHRAESHLDDSASDSGASSTRERLPSSRSEEEDGQKKNRKRCIYSYPCSNCSLNFESMRMLDRHRESCHPSDPYCMESIHFQKAKRLHPRYSHHSWDAVFYNNVSKNIAINLNHYIDGGMEALSKARMHIKIPNYDEVEEKPPQQIDWQLYNYPQYYQPYESVIPVTNLEEGNSKTTISPDILEMTSTLEVAGDIRLTRSSLNQISKQSRSMLHQKSSESRSDNEDVDSSSRELSARSSLDVAGNGSEESSTTVPSAGNSLAAGSTEDSSEKMAVSVAAASELAGQNARQDPPMAGIVGEARSDDVESELPQTQAEGSVPSGSSIQSDVAVVGEAPEKPSDGDVASAAVVSDTKDESTTSTSVHGSVQEQCVESVGNVSQASDTSSSEVQKSSGALLSSDEKVDVSSPSSTEAKGFDESSASSPTTEGNTTRKSEDIGVESKMEPVAAGSDDSSVFGDFGEEPVKENFEYRGGLHAESCDLYPREAESTRCEEKTESGRLPIDSGSGQILDGSAESTAAEAELDFNQNSPSPPVLCAIGDPQVEDGLGEVGEGLANSDSNGSMTERDCAPPPLSPVPEAKAIPDVLGGDSLAASKNDLMLPAEETASPLPGGGDSDLDPKKVAQTACDDICLDPKDDHLCCGPAGTPAPTSSVDPAAVSDASSCKCLAPSDEGADVGTTPCWSETKTLPSPDRLPRALSLTRKNDEEKVTVEEVVPQRETEEDYNPAPLSPRSINERYAFGKCGPVLYLCSYCRKQYYDPESCERHQQKWHPSIVCSVVALEAGNGIENLYFPRRSNVGILASSTPVPEDIHDLPSYTCTRCHGSFKTINRLHYHIIDCDPNRADWEKSSKKRKKKSKRSTADAAETNENGKSSGKSPPKKLKTNSIGTTTMQKAQASVKRAKDRMQRIRQKKKRFPIEDPATNPLQTQRRRSRNYELQYNPKRHRRRRETAELLATHQCRGCETTFKTLSLLERHAPKCTGKDRLQNQKPVLSSTSGNNSKCLLPCRYCFKKFIYLKTLSNHYRKFCASRKEKKKRGDLSEEDLKEENALLVKIHHSEQVKMNGTEGKKGKGGWPKGMKRKGRRKHQCWTYIKRRTRSMEAAAKSEMNSVEVGATSILEASEVSSETGKGAGSKGSEGKKKSKNGSPSTTPTKSPSGKSPSKSEDGSTGTSKAASPTKTVEKKKETKASAGLSKAVKAKTSSSASAKNEKSTPTKSSSSSSSKSASSPKTAKSGKASKGEGHADSKDVKWKGSLLQQVLESKGTTLASVPRPSKSGGSCKSVKNKSPSPKKNGTTKANGKASQGEAKSSPSGKAAGSKQSPSGKSTKSTSAAPLKKPAVCDIPEQNGSKKTARVVVEQSPHLAKNAKVVKVVAGRTGGSPGKTFTLCGTEAKQMPNPAQLMARAPNLFSCLTDGKATVDCSPSGSEASR